jgi:hypothetical protein
MNTNIILEHNFKTCYANFSITRNDTWNRTAKFGNDIYISY